MGFADRTCPLVTLRDCCVNQRGRLQCTAVACVVASLLTLDQKSFESKRISPSSENELVALGVSPLTLFFVRSIMAKTTTRRSMKTPCVDPHQKTTCRMTPRRSSKSLSTCWSIPFVWNMTLIEGQARHRQLKFSALSTGSFKSRRSRLQSCWLVPGSRFDCIGPCCGFFARFRRIMGR